MAISSNRGAFYMQNRRSIHVHRQKKKIASRKVQKKCVCTRTTTTTTKNDTRTQKHIASTQIVLTDIKSFVVCRGFRVISCMKIEYSVNFTSSSIRLNLRVDILPVCTIPSFGKMLVSVNGSRDQSTQRGCFFYWFALSHLRHYKIQCKIHGCINLTYLIFCKVKMNSNALCCNTLETAHTGGRHQKFVILCFFFFWKGKSGLKSAGLNFLLCMFRFNSGIHQPCTASSGIRQPP